MDVISAALTQTQTNTQAFMLSAKLNLHLFQHCCFVRHSKLVK